MSNKKIIKQLSIPIALAGAMFCTVLQQTQNVNAAEESPCHAVLTVKYDGRGQVRLLDGNGNYQNQYLAKNTKWKTFAKAMINNLVCYRLGTDKQWIPSKYSDLSDDYSPCKGEGGYVISTPSMTNREELHTVGYTVYNGAGKIRLLDSKGNYMSQYVDKNASYKVFEKGTLNNRILYRIGTDQQWIPSDYFVLDTTVPSASVTPTPDISSAYTTTTTPDIPSAYATTTPDIPSVSTTTTPDIPSTSATITPDTPSVSTTTTSNIPSESVTPTPDTQISDDDDIYAGQRGMWSPAQVEEAKQEFVRYVNAFRAKKGLKPFTTDVSWLQEGAEVRGNDLLAEYKAKGDISHYRANGQEWDDAFHWTKGALGGENIALVGGSQGKAPKEAAHEIANMFIHEGPDGGHYTVLMGALDQHPSIGLTFRVVKDADGGYTYLFNMETGTAHNVFIQNEVVDPSLIGSWANQWKGLMAPALYPYLNGVDDNGYLHIRRSDMGDITGYVYSCNDNSDLPEDQLQSYINAFIEYYRQKYNGKIILD
ncbi:CAP domain-containing protein [Lactobacillus iners]|uniref:CAP domain-containing protein n=1 Tax=Lactobacillus iners TaxID=147802 RepID=UPI000C80A7D7|nr:hypothetical protein [Lactobacillus iners]MDK7317683.1 hypothetical protein [Lactobacillus iners]PMC41250.1 hypothetical protein CJ223_06490 [Lactobacillus iners]